MGIGSVRNDHPHRILALGLVHAKDRDDLDKDLTHRGETGIVIEDITLARLGIQHLVLSGRKGGIKGVGVEIPFKLHSHSAQFQGFGILRTQGKRRYVTGLEVEEGTYDLEVAYVVAVDVFDLQKHVLVPVDI